VRATAAAANKLGLVASANSTDPRDRIPTELDWIVVVIRASNASVGLEAWECCWSWIHEMQPRELQS
jgi:hypothetical protein